MAFLGMRGTGDFTVTGQRPENWRQGILHLYPNGKAPLTAILSMMSNEKTDDPIFHWFEKELPDMRATVSEIYTDVALSSAYAATSAATGDVVYAKMSAADASKFRAGHQIMFRVDTYFDADITAKVLAVVVNGASSYLVCKLLEDDRAANTSTKNLQHADICLIIGNVNAEGSGAPDSLSYDPTEYSNYTQIFKTSLDMTRTARLTNLRTGDQVKEARREALELSSIEMERAILFSKKSVGVGSNGKPERTTNGLRAQMVNKGGDWDYTLTTGTSTWAAGGEAWLNSRMEELFRYGSDKIAFCGAGALMGINALAKAGGAYQLQPMTTSYGIEVVKWVTAVGSLALKTHPLFTLEPSLRNTIVVLEPRHIRTRHITDTTYQADIGPNDLDGDKSQFLSEMGWELHFQKCHAWLDGVGLANP